MARHERFWPLPKPALIISFQPHMHFRGSRMLLEAIHPDGRREVLTDATHYEQNWQITYKYKTPHLFPAGTILHTVSWHDNTANNKHNPDPTAWVGWGSRTMDEMGHGWTDIAFLTDEQYQEELAKRRAQKTDDDDRSSGRIAKHVGGSLAGRSAAVARWVRRGHRSAVASATLTAQRGDDQRRVARVGRRPRRHALRAARSDQRLELQQARRSPGASRPTISASAPTSICRPRR